MSWHLAIYQGLVQSALASLCLLTLATAAVLLLEQPARRIRVIELTLSGLLLLPLLGLIPGLPRWSILPILNGPFNTSQPITAQQTEPTFEPEAAPLQVVSELPGTVPILRSPRSRAPWATSLRDPWSGLSPSPEAETDADLAAAPSETFSPEQTEPAAAVVAQEPQEPLAAPIIEPAALAPVARWPELPTDFRFWIVAAYLSGVSAMMFWSFLGLLAVRRLLRSSRPADAACRAVLREIAGPASDRVALLVSPRVDQPCALAWRPTTIVLPEAMLQADDRQALRWALAHEWSHVERFDIWSWTASGVVRWFYFYQPLLGWLRRQLQLCQDFVADSRAARLGALPEDYAEFLTVVSSRSSLPLAAGLGIGGRSTDLQRRVVMLVKHRRPLESASPRRWNLVVLPIALLLLAALACLGEKPVAAEPEPTAPAETQAAESPPPADAAAENENAPAEKEAAENAAAPNQAESKSSEPLKIAPNDVLQISAVGGLDLEEDGKFIVELDGNVALGPYHGRINLQGKTIAEAEQAIVELMSSHGYRDPKVQVTRAGRARWSRDRLITDKLQVEIGNTLRVTTSFSLPFHSVDRSAITNANMHEQYFKVEPEGTIALGPELGRVRLQGLSLPVAEEVLRKHIDKLRKGIEVSLTLTDYQIEPEAIATTKPRQAERPSSAQAVAEQNKPAQPGQPRKIAPGDTLVIEVVPNIETAGAGPVRVMLRPSTTVTVDADGKVSLGSHYGHLKVEGMPLDEAEKSISANLEKSLLQDAEFREVHQKNKNDVSDDVDIIASELNVRVSFADSPLHDQPAQKPPAVTDTGHDLLQKVDFKIGAMQMREGDNITIEEIYGTLNSFAPGNIYLIKGTYRLTSEKNATLAAYVTTSTPMQKMQTMKVERGEGRFRLILPMRQDGNPHVSFFPSVGGPSFANVYFGTGDSVLTQGWWDKQKGAAAPASPPASPLAIQKAPPVQAPAKPDLIQPLDTIEITVLDPSLANTQMKLSYASMFNGIYLVEPDGDVRLPSVFDGRVNLKGLNVKQASEAIRARVQKKLAPPRMQITICGRAVFPEGKTPGQDSAPNEPYRIRIGDQLMICATQNAFNETPETEVQGNGKITIHFEDSSEDVTVAGLTLDEADHAIHEKHKAYYLEKHKKEIYLPTLRVGSPYFTLGGWKEELTQSPPGGGQGMF